MSLILFLTSSAAFSESWDDFSDLDRAWDGQKTITNKEFEQVMDALQDKQKKGEAKKKRKKAKKISGGGTSLHNELNPDKDIKSAEIKLNDDDGILVNIPVYIYIDGKRLDKGYYKVFGEREKDGKIYIKFYQSQYFMGKVEAFETENDFGEEEVDFARIVEYGENTAQIIYGSVKFNAYGYVPYSE